MTASYDEQLYSSSIFSYLWIGVYILLLYITICGPFLIKYVIDGEISFYDSALVVNPKSPYNPYLCDSATLKQSISAY